MKLMLKEQRKKKGLTQTELAEAADILQYRVSEYERGKHNDMMLSTAVKIAKALDCKLEDLFKEA